MLFRAGLAACLALLPSALVGAAAIDSRDSQVVDARGFLPQPPSKDPFYKPPSGFESTAPGTVLRQRRIAASFFNFIPDPIEAHQLLYRTNAVDGSAIASVTTVFKPFLAKSDKILSWHTAYDAASVDCAPSYSYQLGSTPSDTTNTIEFLEIQLFLLQGYTVIMPDYEGPEAAWTAGRLAGKGVLDSMRAVKNFAPSIGLSKNPKFVGAGYSGGGLATSWAAAMHPTYASDLNVKGWASGGTPANLSALADFLDGTVFSGFLPVAVAGLSKPSAYGAQLSAYIDSIATPEGKAVIQRASNQCTVTDIATWPFQSIKSPKFSSVGANVLSAGPVGAVLEQCVLGVDKDLTPSAPLMFWHSQNDEVVTPKPAEYTRDAWCANGADISYLNVANGGHGTGAVVALPQVLSYVNKAFAGSVPKGCSQSTIFDSDLDPLAFGLALEPIAVGLINFLGKLGTNDEGWIQSIKDGSPIW